jgi:fibro-slime domain-containing protein
VLPNTEGVNLRFDQTITLNQQPSGAYAMDSAVDEPWATLGGYFPIDELGFGAENQGHNFFFTSELRYWFEYRGGEELRFSGDDDVWVFINGQLAVDLGGVHGRLYGTIQLGSDGHGLGCTGENCTPASDIDFAMTVGSIYEVVVFHAERHPGESNYFLTLANFLAGETECAPRCGDGVQTPDEACDLGEANNTGEHGGCNADCTLAPFCGDGVMQEEFGEQCDEGVNTSLYGGCAPGCVLGPFCGDGIVQSQFEQCDDADNDGGYLECGENCQYGERCGDGAVQSDYEQCDDGADNGPGRACEGNCTISVVE